MTEKEKEKEKKEPKTQENVPASAPAPKELPPEALRALAEAQERRKRLDAENAEKEIGGRGGKDPARYGDWEIKGRAIDF